MSQQVKISLNEHDFFLTIKKGTDNLPKYYCKSGQVEAIEASPTKAISTVYVKLFNNSTWYSGHAIMGWNNENILEILKKYIEFFPVTCLVGEYKSFYMLSAVLYVKSANLYYSYVWKKTRNFCITNWKWALRCRNLSRFSIEENNLLAPARMMFGKKWEKFKNIMELNFLV